MLPCIANFAIFLSIYFSVHCFVRLWLSKLANDEWTER